MTETVQTKSEMDCFSNRIFTSIIIAVIRLIPDCWKFHGQNFWSLLTIVAFASMIQTKWKLRDAILHRAEPLQTLKNWCISPWEEIPPAGEFRLGKTVSWWFPLLIFWMVLIWISESSFAPYPFLLFWYLPLTWFVLNRRQRWKYCNRRLPNHCKISDDAMKSNRKTMALYRKSGVNPWRFIPGLLQSRYLCHFRFFLVIEWGWNFWAERSSTYIRFLISV